MLQKQINWYLFIILFAALFACKQHAAKTKATDVAFTVLDSKKTGLNFANNLTATNDFNMFNYMYFYNGAGVAAGDFNNDGLIDLFFASNQSVSKLYINKGLLTFYDASNAANIPTTRQWSTGVSVVDINNDGLLDIYISCVGNYEILKGKNQLLVCKGIDSNLVPHYEDQAAAYGVDFSGFSTQAVFFDYDSDGDLDMYLMNHSVRNNGTFGMRSGFMGTYDLLAGDRFFENIKGHFTDVTKKTGINSSSIGYGLGICVSDINLDGWPDLYIGNDFHENDYLYINQQNGTFKDELTERIMHTSQFSMGVDVADINNDALPDIVSMDMLPADPYILKRSLGEDEYNLFNMKVNYGYMPQYTRNNLQLQLPNGMFSEIGRYAGVYATDWSWSSLWMDFDNDGLKDLFVSNGIPKRLNDMDYVNYVSNDEVQNKIRTKTMSGTDMALINRFPEIKLPNKFFKNNGAASFSDIANAVSGDRPTFSNGAVYADLDNDGDLDIVVNNIADSVLLYQNHASDSGKSHYLQLKLIGAASNRNAIGAKLIVYSDNNVETYEKNPAHGFLSSMEIPLQAGLNKLKVDSIKLVWPDNTFQFIQTNGSGDKQTVQYSKGLPKFDYQSLAKRFHSSSKEMVDVTASTGIEYVHKENNFVEFDREPLMPHMISQEGPGLAVGDINADGLDDVFVGSSRGGKSAIFVQQKNGLFVKCIQPALDIDSNYEDVSACWTDVNSDGFKDLVVASGGNEYFGSDTFNSPRVYVNNGHGNLSKLHGAFTNLYVTASVVAAYDFNGDGFEDLFIGGRAVPFDYGLTPRSYLLKNDGKGHFTDVTSNYSSTLGAIGFVTNAVWFDINKDGLKDLLICCEWGGIYAYLGNYKKFEQKIITNKKGWWNFILPFDADGDGDIDIVAGNLGLNSRLSASDARPVRMYFADFDGNGKKEQVLTYFLQGRETPFANKGELEKQMPGIKKQFLYAEDFAKSTLTQLFSKEKLDSAITLTVDYFQNAFLVNDGNMNYKTISLPWQAQQSCYKAAVVVDANNDKLPDVLMAGNFYANNIQMGRYDADYGTVLINRGNNRFTAEGLNSVVIKGQVKQISNATIAGKKAFIVARNSDSLKVIKWADK